MTRKYTSIVLLPQHEDKLQSSCINEDIAHDRGYYSIPQDEIDTTLSYLGYTVAQMQQIDCDALAIPISDFGDRWKFTAIRADIPRLNKHGKPIKYDRPPNTTNTLDVPKFTQRVIMNTSTVIHITESPLKADAMCSKGLYATSVFGCWSFRTRVMDVSVVLSDFAMIPLQGRTIYLAFDSDAATNVLVRAAERQIANFLVSKGAKVFIVRLPFAPNGAKQGIDDFFASGGTVDEYYTLATEYTLQEYRLSDGGNAKRLLDIHGQDLHYVYAWRKWLVWDGERWSIDDNSAITKRAKDVITQILTEAAITYKSDQDRSKDLMKWAGITDNKQRVDNLIVMAQSEDGVNVKHVELDTDPYLINCHNGVIDLQTGTLLPHKREDLMTKVVNANYCRYAQCDKWETFLDQIMAGNHEMVRYLQRAIGYSLTGLTIEQCLFFLYGGGSNGKTTFIEVLLHLIGEYGQRAPVELLMAKDRGQGGIPNDVARLISTRLVVTSETRSDQRLDESRVKDLTGGDRIVARYLHAEFFEFGPTHKIWMYGNHKPTIRDTDDGIWRRIHLIPFNVRIRDEDKNPNLIKELLTELPGIFRWAVDGAVEYFRNGLQRPPEVIEATKAYRLSSDVIGGFIDECINHIQGEKTPVANVYEAYKRWADANGEKDQLSKPKFNEAMLERGYTKKPGAHNVYTWVDITITQSL